MANELQIFSFEKNFMDAMKTILAEAGLQVLRFSDPSIETLPRAEVSMTISNVIEPNAPELKTPDGKRYLYRYRASIRIEVYSAVYDEADGDSHFERVSRVRQLFSYLDPKLKSPALPYYQVKGVFEQGSENGVATQEDNELVTALNFGVDFVIPPTAFAD